ncbi:MAG: hypothetical protein ACRDQV_08000 [Pseudonocardiaceae bacterium]
MSTTTRYDVLLGTLEGADAQPDATLPNPDRTAAPWESGMQATCECLSWRGSLDNLDRRHAEDDLGETLYAQFPVHTRSALAVTHSLLDKGVFTEDELRAKMRAVRGRLERA